MAKLGSSARPLHFLGHSTLPEKARAVVPKQIPACPVCSKVFEWLHCATCSNLYCVDCDLIYRPDTTIWYKVDGERAGVVTLSPKHRIVDPDERKAGNWDGTPSEIIEGVESNPGKCVKFFGGATPT